MQLVSDSDDGYVKMLDGRVDDLSEDEQQYAFDKKPLWKRTAIVGAGPAFNFIFAVFAYWLVFLIGVPALKPVIGEVLLNLSWHKPELKVEWNLNLTRIKTAD